MAHKCDVWECPEEYKGSHLDLVYKFLYHYAGNV